MRPPTRHRARYSSHLISFLTATIVWMGSHPSVHAEPTQPPAGFHTPSGDSTFYIELFDDPNQTGRFPDLWEARKGGWRKASDHEIYYVINEEEDGNRYLSAETDENAIDAGRAADVNLRIYNKLRWRWRVWSLPVGANEEVGVKNDSGAAVRIVFYGGIRPRMLKYVWSSSLPRGTETVSAGNKRIKVIVLESGSGRAGEWIWEEVNAYEDYKRLFGGEPRTVRILGVITDADNTKTFSKADYDDFTFIKVPLVQEAETTDVDESSD